MQRFAISMPVGAWHPFLPQALASLRCQAGNVAVALLDASGDPRVKAAGDAHADWLAYRRHAPDKGQSDAILEGWANLHGDWLGWLNADDILMPGALDRIRAAHAADPALEVIYGHSTILDETGAMTGYHFNVEPPGPRLMQAGIVSQPSCFFARAAYERAGGLNRDLHYTMDWDLWIRLFKAGARFGFVDAPLSMVLWAADTKTASLNRRRRDELRSLIALHAPGAAQKQTFRAFAIHALADRVWPDALKQKVLRRLRRGGPDVFGLGADGSVREGCCLHLAHYAEAPVKGLTMRIDGDSSALELESSQPLKTVSRQKGHLEAIFQSPLGPAQAIEVRLSAAPATYFRSAGWIT
ncbi:MAG: glycosyltransferase family 2 protein [Hyphomonas sp.]